jgi:hypothetical protein
MTTSESVSPPPAPHPPAQTGQPHPARSGAAAREDKPDGTPLETSAKIDGIKKQIEDIALAARDLPSSEELASFNTSMSMAAASLEILRSAEVQRAAEEAEKNDL